MTNTANKKGMTLVELLVYIALASLLLAPIIMLMGTSSRNMARDAASTDMRISGRDITGIMYDDIKNTGFKLWFRDTMPITARNEITYRFTSNAGGAVAENRQDMSSFDLRPGKAGENTGVAFDTLTIRKGYLTPEGTWGGYDAISYLVDSVTSTTDPGVPGVTIRTGKRLMRIVAEYRYSTTTVPAAPTRRDTMILAENVEALQFRGTIGADTTILLSGCAPIMCNQWDDSLPAPGAVTSHAPFANVSSPAMQMAAGSALSTCLALEKRNIRYIQAIVALRHRSQKGAIKTHPAVTLANVTLPKTSIMREIHEIIIPIPNNGLFPP